MNFKDRFKGKTETVSRGGILENLASGSKTPVLKTPQDSQTSSYNKVPTQSDMEGPTVSKFTSNQFFLQAPTRNNLPGQHTPQQQSQSKAALYNQLNNNQGPTLQQNNNYGASKSPYLVNNAYPSMDALENQYMPQPNVYSQNNMRDNSNQGYNQYNNFDNNFNPNSFYNQQTNYMSNQGDSGPKKENIQPQANYGGFKTNQLVKKNFQNLSQQNKQKRAPEEYSSLIENQYIQYNTPGPNYNVPGQNYNAYNTPQNIPYNNMNNGYPPQPQPGYNNYENRDTYTAPYNQPFGANPYQQPGQPGFMNYNFDPSGQYPNNTAYSPLVLGKKQVSESTDSKNYKPYSMKDYKSMNDKAPVNLGGLGPNVNTNEWCKVKEKRDRMMEFSQNVKLFNAHKMSNAEPGAPKKEKEKEKSKRDKALEFAKNIPKPKPKRNQEEEDFEYMEGDQGPEDMGYDNGKSNDLYELEQRHKQYAAQLEKMKIN